MSWLQRRCVAQAEAIATSTNSACMDAERQAAADTVITSLDEANAYAYLMPRPGLGPLGWCRDPPGSKFGGAPRTLSRRVHNA